jgi:hypothetical protein
MLLEFLFRFSSFMAQLLFVVCRVLKAVAAMPFQFNAAMLQ